MKGLPIFWAHEEDKRESMLTRKQISFSLADSGEYVAKIHDTFYSFVKQVQLFFSLPFSLSVSESFFAFGICRCDRGSIVEP